MGKTAMNIKLSLSDYNCLKFLWRWKLCTTALIKHAVYKEKTYYRTYRRLRDLAHARLITSLMSTDGNRFVWSISEKGFEIIIDHLPELQSKGFKSENRDHDFWVTAIHLGEWLGSIPRNCGIMSEQQLRHYKMSEYPEWVPKTSTHRPDGWWNINLGKPQNQSLIALEVELSRKSPSRYKDVAVYYSKTVRPYQVIWITTNHREIDFLETTIKAYSFSNAEEQSFLTIDQYIQKQWQSRIEKGKNQGKTLLEILGKSPENDPKCLSGIFPLDARKCPTVSTIHNVVPFRQVCFNRDL